VYRGRKNIVRARIVPLASDLAQLQIQGSGSCAASSSTVAIPSTRKSANVALPTFRSFARDEGAFLTSVSIFSVSMFGPVIS
jgi:hypothetical protein